jgi:hypothetical protein
MSINRCHFLDDEERVVVAEDIDVAALADAIARARRMLKSRTHHRAVEVWQGTRRLFTAASATDLDAEGR